MENKSRLNSLDPKEAETSAEVEIEEDTEVTEIEEDIEVVVTVTTDSENMTTEDPEEIMGTDPRDASTAAKKATLPRTANNVNDYMILARKPR